jgi:hypothetical protein
MRRGAPTRMKMAAFTGAIGVGIGIGVAIGSRLFRITITNPDSDSDPDARMLWFESIFEAASDAPGGAHAHENLECASLLAPL